MLRARSLFMTALKTKLLAAGLLAAVSNVAVRANETDPEWIIDPVPFEQRTTRLFEISVHRYVPEAGTGRILERRYLLTAEGTLARSGDFPVPVAVTIPETAFGKLLVAGSAWLAYGQLGPQALANFRLVNDLEPIDIAGRWHFEVARSTEARGNVGEIPNLATRGEVRPGSPVIGGFYVEGRTRTVLVRAIGPGLAQFGVTNALAAVRLQLFRYDAPIATNDDWAVNPAYRTLVAQASARAGAFPLEPGVRDAAMVMTLAPGVYTVHAGSLGIAAGTVLLEIYPLD